MVKSKDQPEQGVGEGHAEAEDEEVLVLDRDKGQWELDLENHPLQCINNLGTGDGTKTDEFSEKLQRGGVSFSIQKFILQILDRAF